MLKSAASKVMWVGRVTVFLVGLAVILALLFGVASSAFAHKGNKGFFHLGHRNVSGAVSKLAGKVAGPSLFIGNGSENPKATALQLNVKPGKPPLKVNSEAKVPKLNADQIDGKDSTELRTTSYYEVNRFVQGQANQSTTGTARCDPEDEMVTGGFFQLSPGAAIVNSNPTSPTTWAIIFRSGSTAGSATVRVLCYDFPPARTL